LEAVSRRYAHTIPFIVKSNRNELLPCPNKFDQVLFGTVKQAAANVGIGAVKSYRSAMGQMTARSAEQAVAYLSELFFKQWWIEPDKVIRPEPVVSRRARLHEDRRIPCRGALACTVAAFCLAAVLAGCAPSEEWIKPGVSDTQRDRDAADCLFASADIVPTAQGPQRRLNQDRYRRCMSERGYAVKKAGE